MPKENSPLLLVYKKLKDGSHVNELFLTYILASHTLVIPSLHS